MLVRSEPIFCARIQQQTTGCSLKISLSGRITLHLGQLLTYAAGLEAVTVVWIAERFTDEHRAALDWLNEITAESG